MADLIVPQTDTFGNSHQGAGRHATGSATCPDRSGVGASTDWGIHAADYPLDDVCEYEYPDTWTIIARGLWDLMALIGIIALFVMLPFIAGYFSK